MTQDANTSDTVVNSLSSELEALKEIYLDEFKTEDEDTRIIVSVNLSPSTADLKDQQYVCLNLQLAVCKQQYPLEPPTINIRNPRGLSEDIVARIVSDLNKIANDRRGTNMLYHLIDSVKESLTSNNFPTDKSHYIKKSEEESTDNKGPANGDKSIDTDSQPCPVCREDQDFSNLVKDEEYPPPSLSTQSDAPKSKSNGSESDRKQSEEKEDDEWADAKPEISPDEGKEESKDSNKAESDPSKPETGSNQESSNKETEVTNGKKENETEGKDGKTDINKENKVKRNKSSRRNSRRNRTRSSGRRTSGGDGTTKQQVNGEAISQTGNRRNRSRRRNRTGSFDPDNYGPDYRSQNYRPNNRGRPQMRGQGRNNVGYSSNGGLPSPPYKRNFGNGAYPDDANNLRSDAYNQESYRDRDRPGFYAARVIRPSAGNNANRTRNGTRGSEDSSKASVSPQADSSELNQSTSEIEQTNRPRSRSKNKRRNRSNRNRTTSRNGRYSDSEYPNSTVQPGNGYQNSNKMNNRQGYNYDYNYRSQGSFNNNNKRTSYYNGNYPNYNYGYGGGYNAGYGNGYGNYNYYGRYNNGNYNYGNYNNGNYYRQRTNYSNAPQRNNGYRSSNYKPRKRADTGASQSSVKSNSNTNTTPAVSTVDATTSTTSNSNTSEAVGSQTVTETAPAVVEVNA